MAFERLDERCLGKRSELARESFLLLGFEVLVAEEEDAVVGEGPAEFGEGFRGERLGEIEAAHLGAAGAAKEFYLE